MQDPLFENDFIPEIKEKPFNFIAIITIIITIIILFIVIIIQRNTIAFEKTKPKTVEQIRQ